MNSYLLILTVLGAAILGMAWMPALTKRIHISYSILYVMAGALLFTLVDALPTPDPLAYEEFTVHVTELVVIISLMGTGLRIDEPFSFKTWQVPLKLVSITMVLSILMVAFISRWMFQFDWASAFLLGAVLAPTDPVLADDVQVGPPLEKSRNAVRFSLTAEAGLNDGIAFPFTWLAIALALIKSPTHDLGHWFLFDFCYRILVGVGVGFLIGKVLSYLIFYLPNKKRFLETRDGFVSLSATLLVYGVTELIQGYGFIAVFVAAITIRNYEIDHRYHLKLHSFTDQVERMLMAVVLLLFGGAIAKGLLDNVTWEIFFFTMMMVFIIRPVSSYPSLINTSLHMKERLAISFYGIKGIGSFFYLSFAFNETHFQGTKTIYAIVAMVVLSSIFIHGFSANSVMRIIEKQFQRPADPEKH